MVDSISSYSASSVQSTSTSGIDEEENKKKKAQEEGLFTDDNQQNSTNNTSEVPLTKETAQSTAQSYISTLKAQYPQLASKLDSYYSTLDFTTLCSEAASVSDVRAYIYSETQGLLN